MIDFNFTEKELVEAHQYLYYIESNPVWADSSYDSFCERHGIPGNGGSDCAWGYSEKVKRLARAILKRPGDFPDSGSTFIEGSGKWKV